MHRPVGDDALSPVYSNIYSKYGIDRLLCRINICVLFIDSNGYHLCSRCEDCWDQEQKGVWERERIIVFLQSHRLWAQVQPSVITVLPPLTMETLVIHGFSRQSVLPPPPLLLFLAPPCPFFLPELCGMEKISFDISWNQLLNQNQWLFYDASIIIWICFRFHCAKNSSFWS